MYTHKIISKEEENGGLVFGVEFTNGTKTTTERVVPQDKAGFQYWLNQRLTSLNSLAELDTVSIDDSIDLTVAEPVDTRTQAEKDMALWLERDHLDEQVDKAIAKGYLTGNETKVKNLKAWLTNNFKPEYINLV